MISSRLLRLPILSVLVFALILAVALIAPSVTRPQIVTAQNIYCGAQGYQNVTCPYNGVGLQCASFATDVNGNTGCTSLQTTSCPNGVTVNYGYPCPNNGCTGAGLCYNNPYGTTAAVGIGVCGTALVYGPCTPANTPGAVTASTVGQVNCGNGRYAPSAAACAPATASTAPLSAQTYTCPGSGLVVPSQSQCPQTTASANGTSSGTLPGPSNGVAVTFANGWNLVSAPDGTVLTGVGGSLATLQPGDTGYESMPSTSPLKGGRGYWAYFGSASTQNLPLTTSGSVTMNLPAGTPVLIGNPSSSMATVSGATMVATFDPSTGKYAATTTLKPGQGAWAESDNGGPVTVSAAG